MLRVFEPAEPPSVMIVSDFIGMTRRVLGVLDACQESGNFI